METNRPLLTISLLISNRLDTIPRCLDSLKFIRDAISCELVLIDTSKNPEVKEVLLKYTDQVYEFEWCNDFAKARNECLKHAHGEWFLYLDDDEWFVEVDEIINFFKSGEYKKYGYANYIQRNFLDESYVRYTDCWASRMVRLGDSVKFVSKIHEYFTPITYEKKELYAIVNHSGYIYDSPEKREAHFQRNYPLLMEMIQKEPNHLRWHLHLVQEYIAVEKWNELISFCEDCLDFIAKENSGAINNNIGTFYEGIIKGLMAQDKNQEAEKVCHRALRDKRAKELLIAMMHLRLAEISLREKNYEECIRFIEVYLDMLECIDRRESKIIEQEKALLVGNVLDENNQKIAYHILVCGYLAKGEIAPLLEHYDKLCWRQKIAYTITDVEKYMIDAMWLMQYHTIFAQIVIDAFDKDNLRELFRKDILSRGSDNLTAFQKVVYNLANTMQKVIDGPQQDILDYYNALQKFVKSTSDWYDFIDAEGMREYLGEETPAYIFAAIDIADYLELESKDTLSALSKLKSAVECLPEFAKGMGQFFERYKELEEQRSIKQKDEMNALQIQVISQVKKMLESGQNEAAMQIIEQLKVMFPGDKEIEIFLESIN